MRGQTYAVSQGFKLTCEMMQDNPELDDDSEVWAEFFDKSCGMPPPDSFMEDPDFEEGYRMSCCDRRLNEPGCVVSRHKPSL